MYCCCCGNALQEAFVFCPSCGTKKNEADNINANINQMSSKRKLPSTKGNPPSFSEFMARKETERQVHFKPNKKKGRLGDTKSKAKDEVIINVGLMEYEYGEAKIQRGKSFPVKLSKEMGYEEVKARALKKWEDYDRTFCVDRGYVLVLPDGKLAQNIPGSSEEFTLRKYKEDLGKSYSRIYLYLCPATEKKLKSDTMPITNWLSDEEEEAEMERFELDSEDDLIDVTASTSKNRQPSTSTAESATPISQPSHEQPNILQLYEIADFL